MLFLRYKKRRKLRVQVTGEIGGLLYLPDCNNPVPNETFLKPGLCVPVEHDEMSIFSHKYNIFYFYILEHLRFYWGYHSVKRLTCGHSAV